MTGPVDDGGFRLIGEQARFQGFAFTAATVTYLSPDGREIQRDVTRHRGAVGVIPLDGDDVVLVRQFRAPIGGLVLEIPAGLRDVDGEPPEETARRELVEEAGYEAGSVEPLTRYRTSAGFSDEEVWLFVARDLSPVPRSVQGVEEESMTVEVTPLADAVAAVRRGEITDAKTIIALLLVAAGGP